MSPNIVYVIYDICKETYFRNILLMELNVSLFAQTKMHVDYGNCFSRGRKTYYTGKILKVSMRVWPS